MLTYNRIKPYSIWADGVGMFLDLELYKQEHIVNVIVKVTRSQ